MKVNFTVTLKKVGVEGVTYKLYTIKIFISFDNSLFSFITSIGVVYFKIEVLKRHKKITNFSRTYMSNFKTYKHNLNIGFVDRCTNL